MMSNVSMIENMFCIIASTVCHLMIDVLYLEDECDVKDCEESTSDIPAPFWDVPVFGSERKHSLYIYKKKTIVLLYCGWLLGGSHWPKSKDVIIYYIIRHQVKCYPVRKKLRKRNSTLTIND